MTEWKEEHCSQRPSEFEVIADGFLIQRKDIHEELQEENEVPGWVCQSREISLAEYQLQQKEELAAINEAIDDLTVSILTGGMV